jgi:hypothetical protein
VHKSGGRQPAVVCAANGCGWKSNNARCRSNTQSRAADVSPPWYENHDGGTTNAMMDGVRLSSVNARCAQAQRGVSPPWDRKRLASGAQFFSTRTPPVSPPWKRNALAVARVLDRTRTLAWHGGLRPPLLVACATCRLRCAFPIRNGGCFPRGADTPRSWRTAPCPVAGEITPFAMHKRTFARAAGVSPPWCVARTVADENRTMLAVSRTRNRERRGVSPPWKLLTLVQ